MEREPRPTSLGTETVCTGHPTGIQKPHECYLTLSLNERKTETPCTQLVQPFKLGSGGGDQSSLSTFAHGLSMSDKVSHNPGNIK